MGIQGASSVLLASLISLSLSHMFNATKHLAEKWGHIDPLTIVIDEKIGWGFEVRPRLKRVRTRLQESSQC